MTVTRHRSMCRICVGSCGVVVSVDGQQQIVSIEPDRSHPLSKGYACFKGLQTDPYNGPTRLLHSQKREPDGSFAPVGSGKALSEIGGRLRDIYEIHGPNSIAVYSGTAAFGNPVATAMLQDWLQAIGSDMNFNTMTIDQPAKYVTPLRLGSWHAGKQPFQTADVTLLAGGNPVHTHSVPGLPFFNPLASIKEAKARGLKLIVIDPRQTETAQLADVFLQILPGEDVTVAAGLLHIILQRGWHDRDFCHHHVLGLDTLKRAVSGFDPSYVARRADVPEPSLVAAAELFAHQSARGAAYTSTGPDMAPRSSLSEHLYECLNVICGRFARAGESLVNPGVLGERQPRYAEVIAPTRDWEHSRQSRVRNVGMMFGEMMSGTLADEILTPGPGQIRAVIVIGANPASGMPDQLKIVDALSALDLLVVIDPHMTTTARLADYVIAPKVNYEYPNIPSTRWEDVRFPHPFAQYADVIAQPPAGADVVEDWYVFWSLARSLGRTVTFCGEELPMHNAPSTDDLLDILTRRSQVPLDEIRAAPGGKIFEVEPQWVEDGRPGSDGRFHVMPEDVESELAEVLAEQFSGGAPQMSNGLRFEYRLTGRRLRNISNTMNHLPSAKRKHRSNPLHMSPIDMKREGLETGDRVQIASDHGTVETEVRADEKLRTGVVSLNHGWGPLPGEATDAHEGGVSVSLLVSTDRDYDPITAIPRMSAIPVNVSRIAMTPELA